MHIFVTTEAPSPSPKGAAFADALRALPSHREQLGDPVRVVSCLKYKLACLSRATGIELTEVHFRNNERLPLIRPEARESNVGWIPGDVKTQNKEFDQISEEFNAVWEEFLEKHSRIAATATVPQAVALLDDAAYGARFNDSSLSYYWNAFLVHEITIYQHACYQLHVLCSLVLTDATTGNDIEGCCRNGAYWVHFGGKQVGLSNGYRVTIDATAISVERAAFFADCKYERMGGDHPEYARETAKRRCPDCGEPMLEYSAARVCGPCLTEARMMSGDLPSRPCAQCGGKMPKFAAGLCGKCREPQRIPFVTSGDH